MRSLTLAALFLFLIGAARASDLKSADVVPDAGWSSPSAQPLLASLNLAGLDAPQLRALDGVLTAAGVSPADVAALPSAQRLELVQARSEAYAARVVAGQASADAEALALLPRLAPAHAAAVQGLTERRVEEARRAWEPREASGATLAAQSGAGAPRLAPAAPRSTGRRDTVLGSYQAPPATPAQTSAGLPFTPTRGFQLSHVAAVMERRLASGQAMSEQDYRGMDPETLFAGSETRRMDTLLSRQAADPAQAMLEVIANAQDASAGNAKKVGRFGVGGLQVLGELKTPNDRVVMESGKGDGKAAQLVFWKKDGEVFFDYRVVGSARRGTSFEVFTALGDKEAGRRREFLRRKLRANDRGPIDWREGGRLNSPEKFDELGKGRSPAPERPAVTVGLDAGGYRIDDQGVGMGLKEIFERYLKPYGTDKPVAAGNEPARLLYDAAAAEPVVSLGVTEVEIERLPLASSGRLNLAGDVFIDLPHDTELTEERGTVSLVPADQSITGAIRGMRLLIDRLTDPAVHDESRFALINSVAAAIREKQPASEKGVSRGEAATATDLLWYLGYRLQKSKLLEGLRAEGAAFLPNDARWGALEGLSNRIVFLDPALFSPTPKDYENAGFEALPDSLTRHPAWKALQERHAGAVFFSRLLRQDRALAIIGDGVVVLDKSIVDSLADPEVLVARVERELRRQDGGASAQVQVKPRRGLIARLVRPALLAAAIVAAPLLYSHSGSWTSPGWESYSYSHYEALGNFESQGRGQGAKRLAPSRPFGEVKGDLRGDAFLVEDLKGRLTDEGDWALSDARWSRDEEEKITGTLEVRFRALLRRGQTFRLFDRVNGRIAGISVKDDSGRDVRFNFDKGADELSSVDYSGPATVSYRIELRATINDAYLAENELPSQERRDMPAKWRRQLDSVTDASDAEKKAVIEKIMGEDFEYDASKPFFRDPKGSWTAKAQQYLDRGERIPIICNTSSLYYYIMARYVGLPAVYVGLANTKNGTLYHDLAGHARIMVKVEGKWNYVETTSLMPLKVAADEVLSGGAAGSSLRAWLQDHFPSWFGGETAPQDYRSHVPSSRGYSSSGDTPDWVPYVLIGVAGLAAALLLWLAGRAYYVGRRSVRVLRGAFKAFDGWQRPWSWAKWTPLAATSNLLELRAPWGGAFRNKNASRLFLRDPAGRLQRVKTLGEPAVTDKELVYVRHYDRPWKRDGLYAFDGRSERLLHRWGPITIHNPELVPTPGGGLYLRRRHQLFRVDLEPGVVEKVFDDLPAGATLLHLESRGGVDRFVSYRFWGRSMLELRSLTVSGKSARWDGEPAAPLPRYQNNTSELAAWPLPDGRFVLSIPSQSNETPHRLYHPDRGIIAAPGPFQAVISDLIFAMGPDGLMGYDAKNGTWGAGFLDDLRLVQVKRLGPDLYHIDGLEGDKAVRLFCDGDGETLAAAPDVAPDAAVLRDGVVYARPALSSGHAVDVCAKDAPPLRMHFSYNPDRSYSGAAARVTGLPAATFAPIDFHWWTVPYGYQGYRGSPKELRAEVKRDRAFLDALPEETRAGAPFVAATMPSWSPARLFMSLHGARSAIDVSIRERLDALARANVSRPEWLREVFELVDRVYRLDIGSPDAVAGHYLDLLEAVPELLGDVREAMLPPILTTDGSYGERLAYLNVTDAGILRSLPPAIQLFRQILKDGAESLLRREKDDAPTGPYFPLPMQGQSLSRLIAAARKASASELDELGLPGFERTFSGLAENEAADLSSVRGVVRSQGISAPVWIRELIQNARDALREARRLGRPVEPRIALRSFLSEDGSRWIVSVRDGVGMKLSRFLQAMLVPEATTKTMADEVRGFLALGGDAKEKAQRLLGEFFDAAAVKDSALVSWLEKTVSGAGADDASAAKQIADTLSERMRKGGAGFFGIGFFTVFGGADEVIVRTASGGRLREIALVPVRDEEGRLVDITVRRLREYDGPAGQRDGTEVLRVKNVNSQNIGKALIENAYVHLMAGKYAGAVSDLALDLNGQSIQDGLETLASRDGMRSRLAKGARPRWTVDELFVQEPPAEGLALVPSGVTAALRSAGWNVDFPAATAVVRTRTTVQSPGRYAPIVASLALPAAYRLYQSGQWQPSGLPSYAQSAKVSPWDEPPKPRDLERDAAAVVGKTDDAGLWERYAGDSRLWGKLMLAAYDDKERLLREVLGKELCDGLDRLRAEGEPLRVGPLPDRDAPDYAATVRRLHEEALKKALEGRFDLDKEPAAAGLRRVLARLTRFMDDPPPFLPITPAMIEGLRRCLDSGMAVPLMEAALEAAGRSSSESAVRLFEGWLKSQGAVQELQALFAESAPPAAAEASLAKLWKSVSRGQPLLLSLRL